LVISFLKWLLLLLKEGNHKMVRDAKKEALISAYYEGSNAAKNGKNRASNPYLFPSGSWVEWNAGYNFYLKEGKDARVQRTI
jgi:hypothetical protein